LTLECHVGPQLFKEIILVKRNKRMNVMLLTGSGLTLTQMS